MLFNLLISKLLKNCPDSEAGTGIFLNLIGPRRLFILKCSKFVQFFFHFVVRIKNIVLRVFFFNEKDRF